MTIKVLADKIAKRHNTRDPFQIARDLGFIIVYAPLMEVRGFQQRILRRNLIYINSDLDETQQRLVCAHELAPRDKPNFHGQEYGLYSSKKGK